MGIDPERETMQVALRSIAGGRQERHSISVGIENGKESCFFNVFILKAELPFGPCQVHGFFICKDIRMTSGPNFPAQ
jgi:hypothetical protein